MTTILIHCTIAGGFKFVLDALETYRQQNGFPALLSISHKQNTIVVTTQDLFARHLFDSYCRLKANNPLAAEAYRIDDIHYVNKL